MFYQFTDLIRLLNYYDFLDNSPYTIPKEFLIHHFQTNPKFLDDLTYALTYKRVELSLAQAKFLEQINFNFLKHAAHLEPFSLEIFEHLLDKLEFKDNLNLFLNDLTLEKLKILLNKKLNIQAKFKIVNRPECINSIVFADDERFANSSLFEKRLSSAKNSSLNSSLNLSSPRILSLYTYALDIETAQFLYENGLDPQENFNNLHYSLYSYFMELFDISSLTKENVNIYLCSYEGEISESIDKNVGDDKLKENINKRLNFTKQILYQHSYLSAENVEALYQLYTKTKDLDLCKYLKTNLTEMMIWQYLERFSYHFAQHTLKIVKLFGFEKFSHFFHRQIFEKNFADGSLLYSQIEDLERENYPYLAEMREDYLEKFWKTHFVSYDAQSSLDEFNFNSEVLASNNVREKYFAKMKNLNEDDMKDYINNLDEEFQEMMKEIYKTDLNLFKHIEIFLNYYNYNYNLEI